MKFDKEIKPVNSTCNLGVIFDKEMTFKDHVNGVCRRGFYHVRDLFSLRKSLNEDDMKTAAHAFVTSILDYGNSLLYGISDYLIHKLQLVQNAAVRAVKHKRKFEHISKDRTDLHWLPIEARIRYKYLLITWKCLHNMAPDYLKDLIRKNNSGRTIYENSLVVPRTQHATHGDISFEKVAPTLWNSLPHNIRSIDEKEGFKKSIKTYLFKMYKDDTHIKKG
jgi:hypothetical protein